MRNIRGRLSRLCFTLIVLVACPAAYCIDSDACKVVRMADPGWTDITATNAIAGILLGALGYEQKIFTLSVPITYIGMQKEQIDIFLGNWMPAQKQLVEPIIKNGLIDIIHANLSNARFTLAVPTYVANNGVKNFSDLARYADKFEHKIYGIESGAPANQMIKEMLTEKSYGLTGWHLVESSEQSMLSQVARKERANDWIVFLAWEPNQMNTKFNITYLGGGDDYFGSNYGRTTVNTVSRRGYATQCPNVARLFTQIVFTVDLENKLITDIVDRKIDAKTSAVHLLKENLTVLKPWLAGVKTSNGGEALPAVVKALTALAAP